METVSITVETYKGIQKLEVDVHDSNLDTLVDAIKYSVNQVVLTNGAVRIHRRQDW
jgi:hypothetical protein